MSTNIIFTVPGRTTNYMPVDVNTPKEVLLEKYARDSFSTENSWPFESPSAGYYDITNSDTKLILLNKRITWSHLRGKTKAKREPFVKDQYYDWVEREIEMKAQSERKSSDSSRDQSASKRTTDPSRHFSATGCTFRPQFKEDSQNSFKSKGLSKSVYNWTKPRTSVTESYKNTIAKNDDEEAELIKYFYEMSTQKAGLQDKTHVQNPPYEFLNSYNINHPDLKKGQKLFLNNLCQVYSVAPLKKLKETQYLSLLEKQKQIDKFSRDKFRMHDGENFQKYQEFIKTERPVPNQINCGYFHPKQVKSANTTNYSSYKNKTTKLEPGYKIPSLIHNNLFRPNIKSLHHKIIWNNSDFARRIFSLIGYLS